MQAKKYKKSIYTKEYTLIIERLKKARLDANLTQKEAAKEMGWKSHDYISKLESGQRRIDIIELINLSKIYKKSFKYFLKDIL